MESKTKGPLSKTGELAAGEAVDSRVYVVMHAVSRLSLVTVTATILDTTTDSSEVARWVVESVAAGQDVSCELGLILSCIVDSGAIAATCIALLSSKKLPSLEGGSLALGYARRVSSYSPQKQRSGKRGSFGGAVLLVSA